MAQAKLLLDTNVAVDYLAKRNPFYKKVRLLMMCGRIGEFELWLTSSQITDLIYILSDGGKPQYMAQVLEDLRGLRSFVNIFPVSDREIDRMLATTWKDPEDALLLEAALFLKVDAIITRNQEDFESSLVHVFDCSQFFNWMEAEHGLVYDEIPV